MYHIFRNIELFKESKILGTLYHLVDMNKLNYILDNNEISPYLAYAKYGSVSFTRNKNMNSYLGDSPNTIFKLIIDGSKLSNKYKIRPYVDKHLYNTDGGYRHEREELLSTGKYKKITNAFDYITGIVLIKNRIEKFKGNERDGINSYFGITKRIDLNIPIYIKTLVERTPLPIYVQEGTVIKKDDDYVNSLINYESRTYTVKIGVVYRTYIANRREKSRGYEDIFTTVDKNMNIYDEIATVIGIRQDKSRFGLVYDMTYFLDNFDNILEKCSKNKDKILIQIEKKYTTYDEPLVVPYFIELIEYGEEYYIKDIQNTTMLRKDRFNGYEIYN